MVSIYLQEFCFNKSLIGEDLKSIFLSIYKILDFKILMDYSYWVEGVFLIGTAFLGILWNLIAIYILVTREPMRKLMFNQLLISLLFFDNMFVFLSILDR